MRSLMSFLLITSTMTSLGQIRFDSTEIHLYKKWRLTSSNQNDKDINNKSSKAEIISFTSNHTYQMIHGADTTTGKWNYNPVSKKIHLKDGKLCGGIDLKLLSVNSQTLELFLLMPHEKVKMIFTPIE